MAVASAQDTTAPTTRAVKAPHTSAHATASTLAPSRASAKPTAPTSSVTSKHSLSRSRRPMAGSSGHGRLRAHLVCFHLCPHTHQMLCTNSIPEWDFQDLVRNGMIPQPFSAISKLHRPPKTTLNITNNTLQTTAFAVEHRLTQESHDRISCFLNLILATALPQ
jgi:hypothetical protein